MRQIQTTTGPYGKGSPKNQTNFRIFHAAHERYAYDKVLLKLQFIVKKHFMMVSKPGIENLYYYWRWGTI